MVQVITRHAGIDLTMTIYAHTNMDEMRQALDAIEWEAGRVRCQRRRARVARNRKLSCWAGS